MTLRVFRKKVDAFVSKLYKKIEIDICEYRDHENRKKVQKWFQSNFGLDKAKIDLEFEKRIKKAKTEAEKEQLKKERNQLNKWLGSSPQLSIITVVETDSAGITQTTDLCIDCLYKKLRNYGAFGYKREPRNLGVLFLNKEVKL